MRRVGSITFSDIIKQVRQKKDQNARARARALEILAVRMCRLLDLDFMELRRQMKTW